MVLGLQVLEQVLVLVIQVLEQVLVLVIQKMELVLVLELVMWMVLVLKVLQQNHSLPRFYRFLLPQFLHQLPYFQSSLHKLLGHGLLQFESS